MSDLLLFEFHDARYSRLLLDDQFHVHITFSDLVCFFSTADPSVADVWTCTAELRIENPTSLSIRFPVHQAAHVSDCELTAIAGQSIDRYNLSLLAGQRLARLRILMEGDAEITVEGGTVVVSIGERTKHLESVPWPFN
jgi:hypothetical protein